MASPDVKASQRDRESFTSPDRLCGVLNRERVVNAIDECVHTNRLTVISAPSGYGKTTEAAQWASTYDNSVVWYSLGRFDNDVRTVDRHILRTLQSQLSLASFVKESEDIDSAVAYRAICRSFETVNRPLYLVIDNAHRALEAINEGIIGALVEDGPEMLRIVVVGTTYLDLTFSRFLLYNPRAKLDTNLLRFTESEVRDLGSLLGSPLQCSKVIEYTQGWPIAVRLMILAGSPPSTGASDEGVMLNERLGDYVDRHVLATLPTETSALLLEMAVCDEMTAQTAVDITGNPEAGRVLAECASRGLFLVQRLQGQTLHYHWNTVFAQQCRSLLQRRDPSRLASLHLQAATALEVDKPLYAVEHALSAGSISRAMEILLRRWLSLVIGTDAAAVERICSTFPDPHSDDPRILLIRACAQDVLGEHVMSRSLYTRATNLMQYSPNIDGGKETLLLARLFLLDDRESSAKSSADIRELFETSATLTTVDRASILYVMGWTELRHHSNPVLIEEYLAMAAREAQACHDETLRHKALGQLVLAHAWAGHHTQASRVLDTLGHEDAEAPTPWESYDGGGQSIGRGWIQYWKADAESAYESFLSVIGANESRTTFDGAARMMLSAAAAMSRNPRYCRRAASEIQSMETREAQGVRWKAFKDAAVAMLEEAAGHKKRAMSIARAHVGTPELPFVAIFLAAILRRGGDLPGAIRLLRSQPDYEESSYLAVSSRVSIALFQAGNGKREMAHEWCEAALQLAVPEQIQLPFCDGDLSVRQLLAAHVLRYPAHETFIADCLAFNRDEHSVHGLSQREHDVFALMQTAMTLSEIAQDLQLSINTVKSHQRSIYQKLNVNSRREVRQVQL